MPANNPRPRHPGAKLTDDEVRALRAAYSPCPHCGKRPTYSELGAKFKISAVAVFKIMQGHHYKDV